MPAAPPVEQLRAAGARQPNDMFDVWETSRDRPHSGRITRAAPCSKKTYEQQTAADLEPPVMDVLMRDAITREVRRQTECRRSSAGTDRGSDRRPGSRVQRHDHPQVVADSGSGPLSSRWRSLARFTKASGTAGRRSAR